MNLLSFKTNETYGLLDSIFTVTEESFFNPVHNRNEDVEKKTINNYITKNFPKLTGFNELRDSYCLQHAYELFSEIKIFAMSESLFCDKTVEDYEVYLQGSGYHPIHVFSYGQGIYTVETLLIACSDKFPQIGKLSKFKSFAIDLCTINESTEKKNEQIGKDRSAIFCDLTLPMRGKLRICCTHLFGGKYDDKKVNNETSLIKDIQMKLIIEYAPDIIVGDFNSDYKDNEQRTKKPYFSFNLNKDNLLTYLNSPHPLLESKGYVRISGEYESTTLFEIQVDHIYMKKEVKEKFDPSTFDNNIYYATDVGLSDHDYISAYFEI